MTDDTFTPRQLADILEQGQRTPETRRLTGPFLEQIAVRLRENLPALEADVGTRAQADSDRQDADQFGGWRRAG